MGPRAWAAVPLKSNSRSAPVLVIATLMLNNDLSQMNFGFVFGDDTIAEPYLYVTAYPLPEAMPRTELPEGTNWRSDGFSGAVLLYKDLAGMSDPDAYLQEIWSTLLGAGQVSLASDEK